ncbi:hypothetical protein BDF19DRAFT_445521 [Syncephalis fuscata]|nr:hypothetical protein BDF19DRAFT_445521 [Syncephalis fuscata]
MMLFGTKSVFAMATIVLLLASITHDADAHPGLIGNAKTFHGYSLNSENPFSQKGIKIEKILKPIDSNNPPTSAIGTLGGNKVILTCLPNNHSATGLYNVLFDKLIKNKEGQIFGQGPTIKFPIYEKTKSCYVTPYRCQQTLKEYGEMLEKKYGIQTGLRALVAIGADTYKKNDEINQNGANIAEKIAAAVRIIRDLGWYANHNLEDICLNDDYKTISFVKFDRAYDIKFSDVKADQKEETIDSINGYTARNMCLLAVPKSQNYISSLMLAGSNNFGLKKYEGIIRECGQSITIQPADQQSASRPVSRQQPKTV